MNSKVKPKRTRMRREDRIESILIAARKVFESMGYQQATVAQIAEQLGVTDANVYAFFPTKRDLLVALVSQWYESITQEMIDGLSGISGFRNQLRYIVWRHLKTLNDEPKFCAVAIAESRHQDKAVANVLHQCNRRYTRPLMEVLKLAMSNGEVRQDISPPLVRNMVFGTLEHILWDIVSGHAWPGVEQIADQLSENVYQSVCLPVATEGSVESKLNLILEKIESNK